MGLFSKIKKAFKKVVKKVAGGIKKVVKGVGKVVKKISKSKLFKAILMAGAIIVTGGAAIGAFGGSLASSAFGTWMTSTAATIGSIPVVGTLMAPFKYAGSFLGSTAGKLTDLTGFTTEAGRLGTSSSGLTSSQILAGETPASVATQTSQLTAEQQLAQASQAAFESGTAIVTPTGVVTPTLTTTTGSFNIPTTLPAGTSVGTSKGVINAQLQGTAAQQLATSVPTAWESLGTTLPPKPVRTTGTLTGSKWGDFALNTATGIGSSVATGYALNKLTQGDPTGQMAGLAYEGETRLDPLQIYSGGQALSVDGIYQNMMYGTGDPFYQASAELFKQQTIGVPA